MPGPSFNDLSAFVVLAKHRNFRRAALELQVSPSALSHSLRSLEGRGGVRLVNRTTRSMNLTDAGARLANRLAPAFTSVDEALAELRDESDQVAGRIRIATMEYGARLLIPRVLAFKRLHPHVDMELDVDPDIVDLVKHGFDAGVRLREQVPGDMVGLTLTPPTSLAAAGSPDVFEGVGEPLVPADLLGRECIRQRLASGAIFRWEFQVNGREVTIDPPGTLTLNSLTAIVDAAVRGAGICYVPEHHIARYVEDGRLTRILRQHSPSFDGHCLFYPAQRHQTRAFGEFLRFLRTEGGMV